MFGHTLCQVWVKINLNTEAASSWTLLTHDLCSVLDEFTQTNKPQKNKLTNTDKPLLHADALPIVAGEFAFRAGR